MPGSTAGRARSTGWTAASASTSATRSIPRRPRASRSWSTTTSSASSPDARLLGEVAARERQLGPRFSFAGDLHQAPVVAARGLGIARHFGGERRAVQTAEAIRLALVGLLVFLQRVGGTL